jgi:hypothetical protein
MFNWYRNAAKCYVYLSDVLVEREANITDGLWQPDFGQSRWFTRGWTLQELVAPNHVEFFAGGETGTYLGDKSTLETEIFDVTNISPDVLRGSRPLADCTVEERLTWAKLRRTKREEDHVYSILGIFGVAMPLIYGEGKSRAFRRLSEAIFKSSE